MLANLDNTFGANFIGMVFSEILYGIAFVQAFYYYTHQNDSWYLKHTVTFILILNTLHQALISHQVYTYTITYWGDATKILLISRWSVLLELMFSGVTAFVVQSFLTMRIWRLSGRNIYITGLSVALVTGGLITLFVLVAKAARLESAAQLHEVKGATISKNVLNSAADVQIAATLCTLLNISRTGFHRSEVIINRLIVFTVTTGLPPCLCALGSLISLLVADGTFIFSLFSSCLGCLYTNTLLTTLNARIVKNDTGTMDVSIPFRDFHPNGSTQSQKRSINIETATQNYHPSDDTKLEENSGFPYHEGSGTRKISQIY